MEGRRKYIIMCVGHTHTGKTTFAKKLLKDLSNTVLIDNDDIASFLKEKYPAAVLSSYNMAKRTFREPNLKFLISQAVFKFSQRAKLNIIQSSCNLGKDARSIIRTNAKKHGYTLVTVYFNLPREIILKRLGKTTKNTNAFRSAKTWSEVLPKQDAYAELPPSKKGTIYFEIKNTKDYKVALNKVRTLLLK